MTSIEYDSSTGLKHGTEKWFYRSGQLKETTEWIHGYVHGTNRLYLPDGTLDREVFYVENRIVPVGEYERDIAKR